MTLLSTDLEQGIAGSLVTLRRFTENNLTEDYLDWLRDSKLMKFSNQRFRKHTMESCLAYLDSFVGSDNSFIAIYYEREFIGTMTAYCSSFHGTCDIGLLIGSTVQGKGLGKDAWGTLMAHLLATGTRKITGGALRSNKAMVRIMQSCGMQPDGVRAKQELIDGIPQDILYFAKFGES